MQCGYSFIALYSSKTSRNPHLCINYASISLKPITYKTKIERCFTYDHLYCPVQKCFRIQLHCVYVNMFIYSVQYLLKNHASTPRTLLSKLVQNIIEKYHPHWFWMAHNVADPPYEHANRVEVGREREQQAVWKGPLCP